MREHIEQTLDSREVAEMIEKDHSKLLRDLRRYEEQFTEAKIGFSDFFRKSEYKDSTGRLLPCYRITKKGCEFIAHKLTGIKGTIFTARYINRFHEMQNVLSKQKNEPELPWFIRKFGKESYIMLFRDFESITGINPSQNYTSYKKPNHLIGGLDYNGWAWHTIVNKEEFRKEYGFDYGDDKCMMYLYPCGIRKALALYTDDIKVKMNPKALEMISDSLKVISVQNNEKIDSHSHNEPKTNSFTQPLLQIQFFKSSNDMSTLNK